MGQMALWHITVSSKNFIPEVYSTMLIKPLAVHEHLFIKIVCASKHFLCDELVLSESEA